MKATVGHLEACAAAAGLGSLIVVGSLGSVAPNAQLRE